MRSLVTGGDGFVGRHVIARLVEAGDVVHATTLREVVHGRPVVSGPPEDAGHRLESAAWHRTDVLDPGSLGPVIERARPDRVFHLAGFSSGALAGRRAAEALAVNALGTLHLLEAVRDAGQRATRILVAGSGDVYDTGIDRPLDEDTRLAPSGPYGASKAAQELVALAAGRSDGLDVRVARLFPLVGPGQADPFVVPSFCRQAARIAAGDANPVVRVGNLDVERDFTDVRDGAEALFRIAELEAPRHRTYNVCSGCGIRVGTLLEWILAEAGIGAAVTVEVDPERVRPGEPARVVGSPARLMAETGWRLERDVRRAVAETYRRVASRASLSARS